MTVQPLPIRARRFRGEILDSYARRLAGLNHNTADDIERQRRGPAYPFGKGRRDPHRLRLWRDLGALDGELAAGMFPARRNPPPTPAFTEPDTILGEWVSVRALCVECADGHRAYGRNPDVGRVCVRHRRRLTDYDSTPIPEPAVPGLVSAERAYRRGLPQAGILVDGPVMRLARDLAALAADPDTVASLTARDGLGEDAALYPSQVRYARALARPAFVAVLAGTDASARNRTIRAVVASVSAGSAEDQRWRAEGKLQQVAARLCRNVLDTPAGRVPDDQMGLLRQLPRSAVTAGRVDDQSPADHRPPHGLPARVHA